MKYRKRVAMRTSPLPLTKGVSLAYRLTSALATLMLAVSLVGLLIPNVIYPSEDLYRAFLTNDVVNLLIGLPALLCSMALARRSTLVGLLFWPGALLYSL